jgi:2-methylcitrate dehydratase PrpD
MNDDCGLTRALARYAVGTRFEALPKKVHHEALRAFLNWMGVAVGGSHEEAVRIAACVVADTNDAGKASVIGHGLKTEVAGAAFVNCIASSVLAFDDAHLSSVAHPSGPAAAALLALAQTRAVTGQEFLNALALGIEVQCRVANMLVLPPSAFHPAIYVNGFSGPIGVAVAVGRLLGLDERRMAWAIGLAASQASGFRATHGTMTAHFRPGHATRAGVTAAMLAAKGFECTEDALEASGGFLDVFAPGADPGHVLGELGTRHEMLANRYKPYPCGIVIHPIIDACLEVRERIPNGAEIAAVRLVVNPLVPKLTGKRDPRTVLESHVSVYHWAAAALLTGQAGLAQTELKCLAHPKIAAMRGRIVADAAPEIGKEEAIAEVRLADGTKLDSHVVHARGSLERPMTDSELQAKFNQLAAKHLPKSSIEDLSQACWRITRLDDVGRALGELLP